MHITVAPRYVPPPWEFEKGAATRIVGLEAHLAPEPGPLADYLSAFPGRTVVWDYQYQLWAIYEAERERDTPVLRERLFIWDTAPDPITGESPTDEQIAKMAGKDPEVQRRFMHFDYEFVRRRIRERHDLHVHGAAGVARRIADRNAARAKGVLGDAKRNWAHAWGEIRRYLPAIAEATVTGGRVEKSNVTPQIGVGIDLRKKSA